MPAPRRIFKTLGLKSLIACAVFVPHGHGVAQSKDSGEWPTKPVRIVVPFPPGGVTDALGRFVADRYHKAWGQPVVVENKPGASGMIGAETVAKASADGHTLFLGHVGTHAVNPSLYPNLRYHPVKDFAPIALLAAVPNLLLVHPSVPARTVRELVDLAKSRPGALKASSPGMGTSGHLSVAVFQSMSGAEIVHVPYKGPAPALQAVLSSEVQLAFDTIASSLPHVKAGRLRALGITMPERSPLAPDVPTLDEAGLRGFNVAPWFALFAPAGTPPRVIDKLHRETMKILTSAQARERLESQGLRIQGSSPAELGAFLDRELLRWAEVVREAGVKAE